MNDFFRDNLVVHTHVKKTAGTTLSHGFRDAFGRDRVCDTRGPKQKPPAMLTSEERDAIFVLSGHFRYGGKDIGYFDRNPVYVACVRPPLERYRSAYDFVRMRPDHPDYARVTGKTLQETVEELAKSPRNRINVMARTLCQNNKVEAAELFRHVEENYLIVTPHRRVNDTLNALVPLLGGQPLDRDLYKNKATERTAEDIGELKPWFESANRLDADLVQFVEDNYERWLSQLPQRLDVLKRRGSA